MFELFELLDRYQSEIKELALEIEKQKAEFNDSN